MTNEKIRTRQRRAVSVHSHSSGRWRCTIGRKISVDGTKLVPRDFYFAATKEQAIRTAQRAVRDWNLIVATWDSLYRPLLERLGNPHAAVPHWQPALGESVPEVEIAAYQDRPATDGEIAEAYAETKLAGVFSLFLIEYEREYRDGDISEGTYLTIAKRIRNVQRFYPCDTPLQGLTHDAWMAARSAIIGNAKTRKGAKNYLDVVRQALEWFYGSRYGATHERPTGFSGYFAVKKVQSAPVAIPDVSDLKKLVAGADDRVRLVIYLALNMGAYQADIASLGSGGDGFDPKTGTATWTRAKEPDNALKLSHLLWPETLRLLKAQWQPGTGLGLDTKQIENLFNRHCSRKKLRIQFRGLRKATAQIIGDLIGGTSGQSLDVAAEVCQEFLGQSGPSLLARYRALGPAAYRRMNDYLVQAGTVLRSQGVLW